MLLISSCYQFYQRTGCSGSKLSPQRLVYDTNTLQLTLRRSGI
jgi:hypothetical protein